MKSRVLKCIESKGVQFASALCAVLMLCVVPLVFRDAYFDINRIKVYTVYVGVPVALVLMLAAVLVHRQGDIRPHDKGVTCCFLLMGAFLLSCLASYAVSGFDQAVLLGNTGRYCGLLFLTCCAMAFYMIACGALCGSRLLLLILSCAGGIAALGVVNALGVDPLGFYVRIRRGQESAFMSTIGHFDFFGTYLVMLLPLAGGLAIFSKHRGRRAFGAFFAAVIAMGAAASRTDSALVGVHLACIALLALAGSSFIFLARACTISAAVFLSLPMTRWLLSFSTFTLEFSAPIELLCNRHIVLIAAAALLALASVCRRLGERGVRAPGRKATVIAAFCVLAVIALLFLVSIVYFTVFAPQEDIGAAAGFLRFDDAWGSYRGFVYQRALDAFGGYSPAEKLFGKGLDTTRQILSSYFDHPVVDIVGVFDDAHNQLLQFLITGGILCAGTFAAFYLAMLATLLHRAGNDPLLCGAFASVFAYSIVMLLNVTQPILIATYFSVCGLGLSRIAYIDKRRRA